MASEEQERYERISRLLEFLANNQAQLSVQQNQFSAQLADLAARQTQMAADLEKLKEIAATHTTQIVRLADTVLSLAHIVEEQGKRTDERFRATDERLRATDERLKIRRAHVCTPVTSASRMPSSAFKK